MNFYIMALLAIVYFVPSINAHQRKHKNLQPIILTNLFFGWTVVLWMVTLIWSYSSNVYEHAKPK